MLCSPTNIADDDVVKETENEVGERVGEADAVPLSNEELRINRIISALITIGYLFEALLKTYPDLQSEMGEAYYHYLNILNTLVESETAQEEVSKENEEADKE